jgi:hypothetical protein
VVIGIPFYVHYFDWTTWKWETEFTESGIEEGGKVCLRYFDGDVWWLMVDLRLLLIALKLGKLRMMLGLLVRLLRRLVCPMTYVHSADQQDTIPSSHSCHLSMV